MKKNLSILSLLLIFIVSCSKDDSNDACTPINCLNGGTQTVNCGCDCPDGYSGTDCSQELTPSKVIITKAIVKSFPNTESDGTNWDFNLIVEEQLADIYITIENSSFNILFDSPTYYLNVLSGEGEFFEFDVNLEITDVESSHLISVWDYDPSSDDDFMATAGFFPYENNNGFPNTLTVLSQTSNLLVDLELSYQW